MNVNNYITTEKGEDGKDNVNHQGIHQYHQPNMTLSGGSNTTGLVNNYRYNFSYTYENPPFTANNDLNNIGNNSSSSNDNSNNSNSNNNNNNSNSNTTTNTNLPQSMTRLPSIQYLLRAVEQTGISDVKTTDIGTNNIGSDRVSSDRVNSYGNSYNTNGNNRVNSYDISSDRINSYDTSNHIVNSNTLISDMSSRITGFSTANSNERNTYTVNTTYRPNKISSLLHTESDNRGTTIMPITTNENAGSKINSILPSRQISLTSTTDASSGSSSSTPSSTSSNASSTSTPTQTNNPGKHMKKRKRRSNLPKAVVSKLNQWLAQHMNNPYPTASEKLQLMNETGLNSVQLSNWFINVRRRKVFNEYYTLAAQTPNHPPHKSIDENCVSVRAARKEQKKRENLEKREKLAYVVEKLGDKNGERAENGGNGVVIKNDAIVHVHDDDDDDNKPEADEKDLQERFVMAPLTRRKKLIDRLEELKNMTNSRE